MGERALATLLISIILAFFIFRFSVLPGFCFCFSVPSDPIWFACTVNTYSPGDVAGAPPPCPPRAVHAFSFCCETGFGYVARCVGSSQ